MPLTKFESAIGGVDWKKNIGAFLADKASAEMLSAANLKLAIWSRQLENADGGNPALCFVREMQITGQHVTVLVALSLYKPAAGSIRSVLETALYYSYFRTHFSELETLARGNGYYLEKKEVLEFHKEHTLLFGERQQKPVPRHSDSDWLIPSQFRMGRSSGATRIWMLRATPG
jgi:hypothetical protein